MAEAKDKFCVRCNHKAAEKDKYCVKCGAPLLNTCSNQGDIFNKKCSMVNREDAAYCAGCGAPTTFHKHGLIEGYQAQSNSDKRRP